MKVDLVRLVRRLETAQALQSRSFLLEAIRKNTDGPACALRGRWGFAHYFADGHFLNQALALGLRGPCRAAASWHSSRTAAVARPRPAAS